MIISPYIPSSVYIKPSTSYRVPGLSSQLHLADHIRNTPFVADFSYQKDALDDQMQKVLDEKVSRDLFKIRHKIPVPGIATFYLYDIHMQYDESSGGNVHYLPSYLGIAIKNGRKEYLIYNPDAGLVPFRSLSVKDLQNLARIMPTDLIPKEDFDKAISARQSLTTDKLKPDDSTDKDRPRIQYSPKANKHRLILELYARLTGNTVEQIVRENQIISKDNKKIDYEAAYQNIKSRSNLWAFQATGPLGARIMDYFLEHPPIIPFALVLSSPLILSVWELGGKLWGIASKAVGKLGFNRQNIDKLFKKLISFIQK